jgi:drug/metabolite transporter (DMT)-like permease
MWIIGLAFLILFEVLADIIAKEYSLYGGPIRWLGAIMGYITANAFWLWALKNGSGLARGAIIFSVATAILATGVGIILYKEHLNKYQILGVIIGIISLILIFYEKK